MVWIVAIFSKTLPLRVQTFVYFEGEFSDIEPFVDDFCKECGWNRLNHDFSVQKALTTIKYKPVDLEEFHAKYKKVP